ncbi:hypothetical protein GCM10023115_19670 [Pontixanthobacter gangjinensis]|uniref:Uncharacterized protein n=1 Tax=Pontixanthobacter gangjinensis TaxID=1028742 RepID=A0A6I4SQ76_9SPHN|nr:hypothetical protein [Pontixanthobacter gangjinensis]MXO57216.1 hypothetical protein [Pontixanthobacter gangjinensis]
MKKLMFAAAAALCVPAMPSTALADGHEAMELAKVDWYRVNLIKWEQGKTGRAHEIIDLFQKVDEALGRDGTMHFHMGTGEWDSIVAMPMRNGIAAMGWANNPDGDAWDAEFAKQNGGEEKAKAIWDEFNSLIARQQRHIGHIDQD